MIIDVNKSFNTEGWVYFPAEFRMAFKGWLSVKCRHFYINNTSNEDDKVYINSQHKIVYCRQALEESFYCEAVTELDLACDVSDVCRSLIYSQPFLYVVDRYSKGEIRTSSFFVSYEDIKLSPDKTNNNQTSLLFERNNDYFKAMLDRMWVASGKGRCI